MSRGTMLRVVAASIGALCGTLLVSCTGTGIGTAGYTPRLSTTPTPAATALPEPPSASLDASPSPKRQDARLTIAWQPAHQGDTGADGWREYEICGDIAKRAIAALPEYEHVLAWDTKHGLTGSNNYRPRPTNIAAFDRELTIANRAHADAFISVHNDGGAPSGVLGEYLPGDTKGKALCQQLVDSVSKRTGLPSRGLRAVKLYSLEPKRNDARYRCLLEIGDNARDRAFLEDSTNRQRVAEALAEGLRAISEDLR